MHLTICHSFYMCVFHFSCLIKDMTFSSINTYFVGSKFVLQLVKVILNLLESRNLGHQYLSSMISLQNCCHLNIWWASHAWPHPSCLQRCWATVGLGWNSVAFDLSILSRMKRNHWWANLGCFFVTSYKYVAIYCQNNRWDSRCC